MNMYQGLQAEKAFRGDLGYPKFIIFSSWPTWMPLDTRSGVIESPLLINFMPSSNATYSWQKKSKPCLRGQNQNSLNRKPWKVMPDVYLLRTPVLTVSFFLRRTVLLSTILRMTPF